MKNPTTIRMDSSDSTVLTSNVVVSDVGTTMTMEGVKDYTKKLGRRRRRGISDGSTETSTTSISSLLLDPKTLATKWWNLYRPFVQKHRIHLELVDEGLCRLLFWIPHSQNEGNGNSGALREALFGLLSINRLLMECSQYTKLQNSYGTSVEISNPNIPATSIRIALSVIHCLMPSLLGIMEARQQNPSTDGKILPLSSLKNQTYLRFCLERLKFLLRLILLVSYWKQYNDEELKSSTSSRRSSGDDGNNSNDHKIPIGILLDGGMFYDNETQGLSSDERNNLERRYQYTGRRTGLKVANDGKTSRSRPSNTKNRNIQTILGELMYALRPLHWSYQEYIHHHSLQSSSDYSDFDHGNNIDEQPQNRQLPPLSLLKGWVTTILMDMISLQLLSLSQKHQQHVNGTNRNEKNRHWSSTEIKRRKMKLFLYLLRLPFWSHMTLPILNKSSGVVRKIPLLGGLIDACLWDWILYHKQTYVSEEG